MAKRKTKVRAAPIHQLTIAQFEAMFPDEDACAAYLASNRWPDGARCPRCGHHKVWALESRKHHWVCKNCATSWAGASGANRNNTSREQNRFMIASGCKGKGIPALQGAD